MRLGRIDLIRYGRFTDRSFALPRKKADIHIIFGPNEAGKSTALAAIEDLLFGIPTRSPYGFLHDYPNMRVGALLENGDGPPLEALRRKGSKDTLLDTDGNPIPGGEGVLKPFLVGADRSFFERMFSLNHDRLRAGGQEILKAKDDVGQALFSAGAGLADYGNVPVNLRGEADELWSKHARQRKYHRFKAAFIQANSEEREHKVSADKWRELRRAKEEAGKEYEKINEKIQQGNAEQKVLSRIRRVFPQVCRKQELDAEFKLLENVVLLPEDAAEVLAQSERNDGDTVSRIEAMREQLGRVQKSIDELKFDETLVRRANDIRRLRDRGVEVSKEEADLPNREAELNAAEEEVQNYARELGRTDSSVDELADSIPTRTKVKVVRDLLNKGGKLENDLEVARNARLEFREEVESLKKRLGEAGDSTDVSRLTKVIKTVDGQGDIQDRVKTSEKDLKDAQGKLSRHLKKLNPGVSDEEALANMAVPAQARVQDYRERKQHGDEDFRAVEGKISSVQNELDGESKRAVQNEQVDTLEQLNKARERRNALWSLVKRKYLEKALVSKKQAKGFEEELDDLGGAFEPAMSDADKIADSRFDHAEAIGRAEEIDRKVKDLNARLEQEQRNRDNLVKEGKRLEKEWLSMWDTAPFDPLTVDDMLEWIRLREESLELIEKREEVKIALEASRSAEQKARKQLTCELDAVGFDVSALINEDFNFVLDSAREERDRQEGLKKEKDRLTQEVKDASKKEERIKWRFRQASEARETWHSDFASALVEIGIPEDTVPETVAVQLDFIEQMRTANEKRKERHDRIGKMKRDVADFERDVKALAKDLADDLSAQSAKNIVLELEKRLDAAEDTRKIQNERVREAEKTQARINTLEEKLHESSLSIAHLKREARAENNEALKGAIEKSEKKRSCENERRGIIENLIRDGDGKSLREIEEECAGIVIDEVPGREEAIQNNLDDLRGQLTKAAEERKQAREACQKVGGEDAAARAAAYKQEALTGMREVAERYVRVKTSALLLQWAIDRYRQKKQNPLLKRAGELFQDITGGSFAGLKVVFEDDVQHLAGLRPGSEGGKEVSVFRMSEGTVDQLYLALRVAAIEDYLERADALPFVADDLFINFDDERAAAGLKLLGELSRKTQVLFFTHHQHLVTIAQETLGGTSINLVNLAD